MDRPGPFPDNRISNLLRVEKDSMMKRKVRRVKMEIYGELLSILKSERGITDRIVLTRVQTKMNVPFDRLKKYISDLEDLNLIEDQVSFNLTEKGRQYLNEYRTVLDFMERMGIAPGRDKSDYAVRQ